MKPGFELVAALPPGSVLVSMIEHMGVIYVATQSQVFYLDAGVLTPMHFILQKEGPAEASPKGVQPPGEKQPPGNTGA